MLTIFKARRKIKISLMWNSGRHLSLSNNVAGLGPHQVAKFITGGPLCLAWDGLFLSNYSGLSATSYIKSIASIQRKLEGTQLYWKSLLHIQNSILRNQRDITGSHEHCGSSPTEPSQSSAKPWVTQRFIRNRIWEELQKKAITKGIQTQGR